MKNEKGKNILLGVLIVGLVSMTVAFAALSTQLNISGSAEVTGGTWKVQFESLTDGYDSENDTDNANATITNQSGTGTAGAAFEPGITLNATAINNVKAVFTKPGQEAIYKFKIHNAGTINAIITSLSSTVNGNSVGGITCTDSDQSTTSESATLVCSNLTYAFEYSLNGTTSWTAIAPNQTLNAGDSVYARIRLTYANDNKIPSKTVTVTGLDRYIIYSQN